MNENEMVLFSKFIFVKNLSHPASHPQQPENVLLLLLDFCSNAVLPILATS